MTFLPYTEIWARLHQTEFGWVSFEASDFLRSLTSLSLQLITYCNEVSLCSFVPVACVSWWFTTFILSLGIRHQHSVPPWCFWALTIQWCMTLPERECQDAGAFSTCCTEFVHKSKCNVAYLSDTFVLTLCEKGGFVPVGLSFYSFLYTVTTCVEDAFFLLRGSCIFSFLFSFWPRCCILQYRCCILFSVLVLSVSAKSLPCINDWCNARALFSFHFLRQTIECFCLFVQLMQGMWLVVVFSYQLITNCRLNSDELVLLLVFLLSIFVAKVAMSARIIISEKAVTNTTVTLTFIS